MVESAGNLVNLHSVKPNHKVDFCFVAIESRSEGLFPFGFDL